MNIFTICYFINHYSPYRMQHKKIAKFVPKNKVEKVKKFLIIKKKLQGDLPLAQPPTIIIGTVGLKYYCNICGLLYWNIWTFLLKCYSFLFDI